MGSGPMTGKGRRLLESQPTQRDALRCSKFASGSRRPVLLALCDWYRVRGRCVVSSIAWTF
eukprot:580299-Alexandrium_andersonii.AAC.1